MADGTEPVGSGLRIFVVLALLFAAGAGVWVWQGGLRSVDTAETETPEAERATPAIDAQPVSEADDDTDVAAVSPGPADASEEASGTDEVPTDAASAGGEDQADAEPSTDQDVPDAQAPTFDVVRVGPDGSAVIAGRAVPGSVVDVQLDGTTVGEATADGSGGFVAILDLGSSDQPRALSLNADSDGKDTGSEQVVVLAPSEPVEEPEPEPAAEDTAATLSEDDVLAQETAEADTPAAPEAPAFEPLATETPPSESPASGSDTAAPSVILADRSGIRILQGTENPSAASDNVVIDAITYDAEGEVALSGRAAGEGFVRVYVDNAPIETGTVNEDGQWRVDLPDVDTGTYALRVDQVDAEGQVVSRTETPFQREAPEAIQSLADEQAEDPGQPLVELVTVQPGNTLWGISQRAYGEGTLFVRVFEANRAKITEPDLIYPGQVFSVPN